MKNLQEISFEEVSNLMIEIGSYSSFSILLNETDFMQEHEQEWGIILNNSMPYNPYSHSQLGMSNNEKNAEKAMNFLKRDSVLKVVSRSARTLYRVIY